MTMAKRLNKRAASVIEYTMLIIMVVGVLMVMKEYLSRSVNGHWKAAGDSLAFGRQYQAGKTTECAFAAITEGYGVWYDNTCYAQAVTACPPGNVACEDRAKACCCQDYCCDQNTEAAGGSNCGADKKCDTTQCVPVFVPPTGNDDGGNPNGGLEP